VAIEKTLEVFARIGFSDVIVPLEKEESNIVGTDTYLVGYEDGNGRECERDGTYLDQNYKT
jgi:hypothetical protein